MNATGRHGVTLLELTVGVTVMTGIIASSYFCLHAGFTTQAALDDHMEQLQKARVVLSLMTKDLRHACVWSEDFTFVGMDRTLGNLEADNLDFATHNWSPRTPGEGDLCEVSYYLNRNPQTGELGIWRRRDTSPDPEPTAGGEREELIGGVRALRFEYYDGFSWYDEWGRVDPRRELPSEPPRPTDQSSTSLLSGNLYGLPDAVRISIALGEGPDEPARRGISKNVSNSVSRSVSRNASTSQPPDTIQGTDEDQTPMVFQTIVHLNLAGRARSSSFQSETGNNTGSEGSPESSTSR